MFCPECGKTIEEGVGFCSNCGTKVGDTLQAVSPVSLPIKRPLGIVFIGVWNACWGVLTVCVGALCVIVAEVGFGILDRAIEGLPFGEGIPFGGEEAIMGMGILGYLILLFGMFEISAAYGVWSLTRWGKGLTIILCILSILLAFFLLKPLTFGKIILTLMSSAIVVAIIVYLNLPSVKKLFH